MDKDNVNKRTSLQDITEKKKWEWDMEVKN